MCRVISLPPSSAGIAGAGEFLRFHRTLPLQLAGTAAPDEEGARKGTPRDPDSRRLPEGHTHPRFHRIFIDESYKLVLHSIQS